MRVLLVEDTQGLAFGWAPLNENGLRCELAVDGNDASGCKPIYFYYLKSAKTVTSSFLPNWGRIAGFLITMREYS